MTLAKITDHLARGLGRLLLQYRDKLKLQQLLAVCIEQVQEIEDALWQLWEERKLDTAAGAQLDTLGAIVGQAREGVDDDTYRLRIRARIRLNRSSGTAEDVYGVMRLLVPEGATLELLNQPPAGFVLRVNDQGVPAATLVPFLVDFLEQASAGGVRGILEYMTVSDGEMLRFGRTCTLARAHSAGETILDVDSTEGFPNIGSVQIDFGVGVFETRAYSSIASPTRFNLSAGLASAHQVRAAVTSTDSPGLLLQDLSSPSGSDGVLAGAEI